MGPQAVHSRLYRQKGAAKEHSCVGCGGQAFDWAYQYTAGPNELVSEQGQKYSEDPGDYAPMCRRCHNAFDRKREPEKAERMRASAKAVPSEIRQRAGKAFANRLKSDEVFAVEMAEVRARAQKAGVAAALKKGDWAKQTEALKRLNARRVRCGSCGKVSTPAGLVNHQRLNSHQGREDV